MAAGASLGPQHHLSHLVERAFDVRARLRTRLEDRAPERGAECFELCETVPLLEVPLVAEDYDRLLTGDRPEVPDPIPQAGHGLRSREIAHGKSSHGTAIVSCVKGLQDL